MGPLKRASDSAKQATLFSFFGKKTKSDKPAANAGDSKKSAKSLSKSSTKNDGKGSSNSGKVASKPAPKPKKIGTPAKKSTSAGSEKKPRGKELSASAKKRRRRAILEDLEDTDAEEEWDAGLDQEMSQADSGSEFEAGDDANAEESELEYDDEDEEEASPPPKKRKTSKSAERPLPPSSTKKTPAKSSDLSCFARDSTEPMPLSSTKKTPAKTPSLSSFAREVTPSNKNNTDNSPPPPMFVQKALNPAGSHLHNHLPFLRNPRDARGRSPDDENYDNRTLRVVKEQWAKLNGSAMTNAVEQWWDLKAQYFDTVLLFKTGKFYEMFHMDADIGVNVLNLSYMKGHVAHAGFPEVSYGVFANKLCCNGYKVARVEQTETPDMLKERKKTKDRSAKVVNREVCSVLSLGTRTYNYMDDVKVFEENANVHIGPLLCISEKRLQPDKALDATFVREFGVTVVDAPRGQIFLAQFQDDCLCGQLQGLLAAVAPSEILYQDNPDEQLESSAATRQTLQSFFLAYRSNAVGPIRVEQVKLVESFPRSTALDRNIRTKLNRMNPAKPWDVDETLSELRRIDYFGDFNETDGWPELLHQVIQNAESNNLALSSFGCALFTLQRCLIDKEILSMGIVEAFSSPTSTLVVPNSDPAEESSVSASVPPSASPSQAEGSVGPFRPSSALVESMTLEGTTLHNLEVLSTIAEGKVAGSLWSKLYHTKTPQGSRMLRAWLLRPLFNKADIDKRADAVEDLVAGSASMVSNDVREVLKGVGDIERLLSRVQSMGATETDRDTAAHPTARQVLYEEAIYTKRKVKDFRAILEGLKQATKIPQLFECIEINSPLLKKLVTTTDQGGFFPVMEKELNFFFENVDLDMCAKGQFEPSEGMDPLFDQAAEEVKLLKEELENYRIEQSRELRTRTWKYLNTDPEKKDPWLIELPASVNVPEDYIMKGKRGSGQKQVNKYRTDKVEKLVAQLLEKHGIIQKRRAKGLYTVFSTFDEKRNLWEAAATATATLDALCSLAHVASLPGYCRPNILEYEGRPILEYKQGRHPCVEGSSISQEFIPNDLSLGTEDDPERVLLLSGPNMGGKSTFLRMSCIISILAQIGSYVPADECSLTPVDRIYTRLGASDRILLGQSTFFVELSETASALRGSTDRSLVIMDELGRGTSTFDGTAIASATVKHLVENNKCLTLFATHYHNLLDDWAENPHVRLGHMECMVEKEEEDNGLPDRITFLYTLGKGPCPKSFGIHVGNLAGLPSDVLRKASEYGGRFEDEMSAGILRRKVVEALEKEDVTMLTELWEQAQGGLEDTSLV